MTSKNSSSNGQTQLANRQIGLWQLTCKVIKRHIWLPVLALLGFVLAFPVTSALVINNFMSAGYESWDRVPDWCLDLMAVWQGFSACIIVVGAILSSFVLFRYLHVRTQVDFYHSLPVRREQYFFSNLLAGLLVFLAPYLVAILLNLLVLAVSGWLSYMPMGQYLQYIVFNVLAYLLFFGCGSLAMQLSGTLPSAIKVLLMTFGLAPLLSCMFEMLGACFFDTWVSFFSPVSQTLLKASVLERYVFLSAIADAGYSHPIPWQDWLAALLLICGTLGASLWLYLRRRSESAGGTLAFAWQKPFYKYPLVVCGGLMLGVFFFLMGDMSPLWMYFGAVLGTMFMALLLEIFIRSDFKAIKQGWKSALAASVAVCVLFSVYAFDLTGFDERIPDGAKVQTVYISSNTLNSLAGSSYYSDYYLDDQNYLENYWTFGLDNFFERTDMLHFSDSENVAAVLSMIGKTQSNYESSGDVPVMTDSLLVICKMNNGSVSAKRYWTYNVLDEVHQQAFEQLVGSQELQEQLFVNNIPLDNLVLTEISSYAIGQTDRNLNEQPNDELAKQLVQTMQAEYAKLSADDILYSAPVGCVEISRYATREYDPEVNWYSYTGMRRYEVVIFPQMTETIALLNEHYDNIFQPKINLNDIIEVREYRQVSMREAQLAEAAAETYDDDNPAITMPEMAEIIEGDSQVVAVYTPETDAAAIEQILQNSIRERAIWRCGMWSRRMFDTYYEISYYDNIEYDEDISYNANRDVLTATIYPTPNKELWNRLVYGK